MKRNYLVIISGGILLSFAIYYMYINVLSEVQPKEQRLTLKLEEHEFTTSDQEEMSSELIGRIDSLVLMDSITSVLPEEVGITVHYKKKGVGFNSTTVFLKQHVDTLIRVLGRPERIIPMGNVIVYHTFDTLGIYAKTDMEMRILAIAIYFKKGRFDFGPKYQYTSEFQINEMVVNGKSTYRDLKKLGLKKINLGKDLYIMRDNDKALVLTFDSPDHTLASVLIEAR